VRQCWRQEGAGVGHPDACARFKKGPAGLGVRARFGCGSGPIRSDTEPEEASPTSRARLLVACDREREGEDTGEGKKELRKRKKD
jgi:hypothetical protein